LSKVLPAFNAQPAVSLRTALVPITAASVLKLLILPFTNPTVRASCFGASRNMPRTVSAPKVFKADEPWTTARPPAARPPPTPVPSMPDPAPIAASTSSVFAEQRSASPP
jgi:hypothetical protein